jgi:nicotinate-nucleotide pyrophosphorylase (carboxylating)
LIKDNHLAGVDHEQLAERIRRTIAEARELDPPPTFIEVEVDTLAQLEQVLACDVDRVLLDNMTPAQLRQAVALRDDRATGVTLEASGGVNLQTVRQIAEAGVDDISVGALTHSPPALDLGLDID